MSVDFFFKIKFFEKFFQEYHMCVKLFGSRSGPTFCLNCLQRLSADDTSRQRVNMSDIEIHYIVHISLVLFDLILYVPSTIFQL